MQEFVIINLRPLTQQQELNNWSHNQKIKIISNPLFEEHIHSQQLSAKFISQFKYIIITSKYGLEFLANQNHQDSLNLIVIGRNLYHKTKQYFPNYNIYYAGAESKELIEFIRPLDNLLYLRGQEISNDLKQNFSNKFFEEYICYQMLKTNFFNKEIISHINLKNIIIIPVFSLKTAQEFYSQFAKTCLKDDDNIWIIAFSKKIAGFFSNKFNNIKIVNKPEMNEVIDIISMLWRDFNEKNNNANACFNSSSFFGD